MVVDGQEHATLDPGECVPPGELHRGAIAGPVGRHVDVTNDGRAGQRRSRGRVGHPADQRPTLRGRPAVSGPPLEEESVADRLEFRRRTEDRRRSHADALQVPRAGGPLVSTACARSGWRVGRSCTCRGCPHPRWGRPPGHPRRARPQGRQGDQDECGAGGPSECREAHGHLRVMVGAGGGRCRGHASVQAALPVRWHASHRSRRRLIHRVVVWRGEDRAVDSLLRLVVPEPVLARLVALGDRVADLRGVATGMLRRRGITAAHMPASRTATQVEPPALGGKALDAAGTARWHARIDVLVAGHHKPSRAVSAGPARRALPCRAMARRRGPGSSA